ncbi:MAG TPA: glycosyltransferase family 1 protein [Burkholderiales bacterium]|nr:glycosyltransferase family 1 protein [Burkholderiales bacterium]
MHIVDTTLFFAPSSGGVKRYLLAKHAFLRDTRGVRHTIVVPGGGAIPEQTGIVQVPSPRIPFGHGYRLPLSTSAWADALCALQPDVIEAGDPYHIAWAALDAARRLDIPAVAFAHSDLPRVVAMRLGATAGKLADGYIRRLYSRFELVTAPSRTIARRLWSAGVDRVAVQPLGVDTALFHPGRRDPALRSELGLPSDTRLLIYAGRLSAEKHIPLLPQAARLLGPPYHLLIVGGDRRRREPGVTWLPYEQDTARLARLVASCDALVHAGEHETFGLVFIEAMACGLPVVGVRSGAVPEIVDDAVGRVAEPRSVASLVQAVRSLFAADPRAMGEHARRKVESTRGWEPIFRHQLSQYVKLVRRMPVRQKLALGVGL